MRLIKLDKTGHTELDLSTDEMIAELEKEMNGGKAVVAEAPGQEPTYLRRPEDARGLSPEAKVTVMPQLAGG